VRRFGWVVLGVFMICLGISVVLSLDYVAVQHGVLGSNTTPPPDTAVHPAHVPMSLGTKITSVVFLLALLAIVAVCGYLLAKRRSARDAARLPGEVDEFAVLGPFGWRRRRPGDHDDARPAPTPVPEELPEPPDPRQLPADVAREKLAQLARYDAEQLESDRSN
jgi:hypothetical protein